MGFTLSADDPRSIRALEIAAQADRWLRWRTDDGREAYGIPSQANADHPYVVTHSTCDCADFRRNALLAATDGTTAEQRACKHVLAVRLYTELVRAQQRPRLRLVGPNEASP